MFKTTKRKAKNAYKKIGKGNKRENQKMKKNIHIYFTFTTKKILKFKHTKNNNIEKQKKGYKRIYF